MSEKRIRIGNLDRRITIQSSPDVEDASFAPTEQWSDFVTVWASKEDLRGTERFAAMSLNATTTTRFVIRYRSDITEKMRIVLDDVNYGIDSISEIGRKDGLEILATASEVDNAD